MAVCFERSADKRKRCRQRKTAPRQKEKHSSDHSAPIWNEQDERIANDRDHVEDDERVPMAPAIRDYTARVGIDRTKQSAQRIVKADNENRRADRLQILRHKTHPKLFACANNKNGDEQDDEVAFEPEEMSQLDSATQPRLIRRL